MLVLTSFRLNIVSESANPAKQKWVQSSERARIWRRSRPAARLTELSQDRCLCPWRNPSLLLTGNSPPESSAVEPSAARFPARFKPYIPKVIKAVCLKQLHSILITRIQVRPNCQSRLAVPQREQCLHIVKSILEVYLCGLASSLYRAAFSHISYANSFYFLLWALKDFRKTLIRL